jgi:hypothetical protein
MTSIEQSLEIVIGFIILAGLVYIFFSIFGQAECDSLANATAVELVNKINDVALENKILPWTGEGVPPDEKTSYYTVAPIRLCEKNRMNTLSAVFSAQIPTYILVYETMPEGGFAWSESQPFSGGAGQSVLNYVGMKYGIKGLTLASRLVTKIVKGIISGAITLLSKGGKSLIGLKIRRAWEKAKEWFNRRWIVKQFKSSLVQSTVQDQLDDRINSNYYPDKYKSLVDKIKDWVKKEGLSNEETLVRAHAIDGEFDTITNKWTARLDNGRYVVTPEYRDFMNLWIENAGDAAEDIKPAYYIPSPTILGWDLEKFKVQKWYPFKTAVKNWWNRRWIKHAIDKARSFYDGLRSKYREFKNGFNKWFNYDELNVADLQDLPQEIGINKEYMLAHRDQVRSEIGNNWIDFKGPLESITKKTFASANDVADEDVIRLINNYERYFNSGTFMGYVFRDQEELASIASKALGREVKDMADKVKAGTISYSEFQSFMVNKWDNLPDSEKQAWINKFSSGFTKAIDADKAKEVYEYARVSMVSKGILDRNNFNINGAKWLARKADIVKSDMISSSIRFSQRSMSDFAISDFFLSPIITDSSLSTLQQITSYAWQRGKRAVFLDMNRVGQGLGPVSIAPYNWISSPYSLKESLGRASEIMEGGCAQKSICKIQRGAATGPTETASAYLLDREFPDNVQVKLWRPLPGDTASNIGGRMPIGISTVLLSTSVTRNPTFHVISPCFAVAKIWKSKTGSEETVYVSIEKEKKCDVSNCQQPNIATPSWNIPFINIQVPSFTIGITNADTPNYCYADEKFIWGDTDDPNPLTYTGIYGGCILTCLAATYATGGASLKTCLKACGYVTIGGLMAETALATQAYRDVPSWKRQETGWGYWNYQKAEDICDTIEFISSFGSIKSPTTQVQALPGIPGAPAGSAGLMATTKVSMGGAQKILSTAGQKIQKVSKYTTIGASDICYAILLMGDTSLSWPIKTPSIPPWELIKKGAVLDDKCMQESASYCAWLKKCEPGSSDPKLQCPENMECIENVCKIKSEIT